MNKKQKSLKPGQLVTVENRVYRITKSSLGLPCLICDCTPCCPIMNVMICFRLLIPHNCYLKLIK